jgi:D-lactate dehydrogenase
VRLVERRRGSPKFRIQRRLQPFQATRDSGDTYGANSSRRRLFDANSAMASAAEFMQTRGMRIAFFNVKSYDREYFSLANTLLPETQRHEFVWLEPHLTIDTVALAQGCQAVCVFVNDKLDAIVLERLYTLGVRLVALRCAGFNNVDLNAAKLLGLTVVRVPAYSPHAVAEHAVALIMALNRKTHRAYNRVRDGNFMLQGLCGFDVYGKTVGVVGTGKIGLVFARIMSGFGCKILAYDPYPAPEASALGVQYVGLPELLQQSDIVSLHCPLTSATRHVLDETSLFQMKRGAMLINTGRGALIDTGALILALKQHHLGAVGVDVYEEEEALFFEDHSTEGIDDDTFVRLSTFPNVLVTAHQGFLTAEALTAIAQVTLANVTAFAAGDLERCQRVPG